MGEEGESMRAKNDPPAMTSSSRRERVRGRETWEAPRPRVERDTWPSTLPPRLHAPDSKPPRQFSRWDGPPPPYHSAAEHHKASALVPNVWACSVRTATVIHTVAIQFPLGRKWEA